MAILFHEAAKEFHLYNNTISYIIKNLEKHSKTQKELQIL